MKYAVLLIFTIWFLPTYADEAEDKAEFNAAYAEYTELVQKGDDLDATIVTAEKVYKLARKVYGRNSEEYAIVTYNLADLYDAAGGHNKNKMERKSVEYYEKYFDILESLNTEIDKQYLIRFQKYIAAYHNVHQRKSKPNVSQKLLNYANQLELTDNELASIEYSVGIAHISSNQHKKAKTYFIKAKNRLAKDNVPDNIDVAELNYWLAIIDLDAKEITTATTLLENVIEIYKNNNVQDGEILKNSHTLLAKIYFVAGKEEEAKQHISEFVKIEVPNNQSTQITYDDYEEYLPIVRVNPSYPSGGIRNLIDGVVVVKFNVDEKGETKNVIPIFSSNEMFERNAVRAAEKYKYKPRTIDGVPVEVKDVVVRIEFEIMR